MVSDSITIADLKVYKRVSVKVSDQLFLGGNFLVPSQKLAVSSAI